MLPSARFQIVLSRSSRGRVTLLQRLPSGNVGSLDTGTGEFKTTKNESGIVARMFLPATESLNPRFVPFSFFSFLASVSSSVGGVLSTQSLLIAASQISPSVSSGIGVAATINWILKDGLGQLGGVMFAAKLGRLLDVDPRFYRFHSQVVLQIGSFLELLTALLPAAYFLPLASLANIMKNLSWMGMAATRTKAMEEFQVGGNIAELTSRHCSQVIAASVVGMAGGIGVSLAGHLFAANPACYNISCFPVCAAISVWYTFRSCLYMETSNLTVGRIKRIMAQVVNERLDDLVQRRVSAVLQAVPGPLEVCPGESVCRVQVDPFPNILVNPPLTEAAAASILRARPFNPLYASSDVFVGVVDGKYCLWFSSRLGGQGAIPIIMLACYCNALLRRCSEEGMSATEEHQMLKLFEAAYFSHIDTVTHVVEEMIKDKGWTIRSDSIGPRSSLLLVAQAG